MLAKRRPWALTAGIALVALVAALAVGGTRWVAAEGRREAVRRHLAWVEARHAERGDWLQARPPRWAELAAVREGIAGRLDPDASNPRERLLARLVPLELGIAYTELGRREEADRELTRTIALVEPVVDSNTADQPYYSAMLYLARGVRARNAEAMASAVPPRPSLKAAGAPAVVAGVAHLARAVVDLDRALGDPRPDPMADGPMEFHLVVRTKPILDTARTLNLVRIRPYLTLCRQAGNTDAAVAVADLLDRCPSLHAGEPHYDVASVYAAAYRSPGRPDRERLAAAAVRQLRLGNQCGFGKVLPHVLLGKLPRPTLAASLRSDSDFDGLRGHPAIVALLRELDAQPGPARR